MTLSRLNRSPFSPSTTPSLCPWSVELLSFLSRWGPPWPSFRRRSILCLCSRGDWGVDPVSESRTEERHEDKECRTGRHLERNQEGCVPSFTDGMSRTQRSGRKSTNVSTWSRRSGVKVCDLSLYAYPGRTRSTGRVRLSVVPSYCDDLCKIRK